ncbi:Serine/threonine-protein kinase roco5 [Actinidia chinensis var. chinensis]|uniref:Serine/threonine-protein kinase roco5 n=1 Tax=Actinidia chinensis var. chinensis TaxID=1590841 RepID=A0A2R6PFA8_ACTCC|nr:Serine/threonine-protein kinase roco5 [Actinidia chinensis var. chinensis]
MACFSGLGIGLSFVFGCILLGLVGELYYLLWWKKQFSSTSRGIEDHHHFPNYVKFVPNLFCWKKPNSTTKTQQVTDPEANGSDPDPELGSSKEDLLCKGYGEEGVESELMRLHNLCGPPRFLFTISEETKEDLESDDGRSRKGSRTRSLSDCLLVDPILTPLASPTIRANPNLESYHHHGFNPLFESFKEAEINKLRSSPPPKFKFLRDAEEKLMRRLMEEREKREGSFIRITVEKNKEREAHQHHGHQQHSSTASQVLPLASSPSPIRSS